MLVLVGALDAALACSSSTPGGGQPIGMGDHLYVDVDATSAPPPQGTGDDAAADSPFAPFADDSGIGSYSVALVMTVCGPPEAGAPKDGSAEPDATGAAGDGGASGSGGAYGGDGGCEAFPAACAQQPDCDCLLNALVAEIPCGPASCSLKGNFSIFCSR